MYDLTLLMIRATGALAETPAVETSLPAWATLGLAGIGLISTLGLAWIGYLTQKSSKQVKENSVALAEVQNTARATERKVTSNHGRDNIGDKIDEMYTLVEKVVDITVRQDARIQRVEQVMASAAGQAADNAVIAVTSFSEMKDRLDHLTVVKPPSIVLPLDEPKTGPYCRRRHHDASCAGRRHRKP